MSGFKIELLDTVGFKHAIYAMRRSHDSNDKSDSFVDVPGVYTLGNADLSLMQRLVTGGPSHSSFMRFIVSYLNIDAPRYWWQQFDRYRHGVERLSDSTMHTLIKRGQVSDKDFSVSIDKQIIDILNTAIDNKDLVKAKAILPEAYIQGRTVMVSYQALRHMYNDRKSHRLEEWTDFCSFIDNIIPYGKELISEGLF